MSAIEPLYATHSKPPPAYQPVCFRSVVSNVPPTSTGLARFVRTCAHAAPPLPNRSQSPHAHPRRPPAVKVVPRSIWQATVKLLGAMHPVNDVLSWDPERIAVSTPTT